MAEYGMENEFKRRREQIRYAKKTWMNKGLIGTANPSNMRMLIEFYRGNQWNHLAGIPGIDHEALACVNKVFPIANAIKGDVAARNPQVEVFPRAEDYAKGALPVQNLLNYDIQELKFKRQLNRALDCHLFGPFGAMRHGFTPTSEYETEKGRRLQMLRYAKPDKPYIQAVMPWNVFMDPNSDSFHPDEGLEWVAFRDVYRLADIRDNPNMIARDELKNFAGNISPEWAQIRPDYYEIQDDPDMKKFVEVFTYYESRERTWCQLTLDGLDKYLRKPSDWPIDWETLPINFLQVNEQLDTPFSLSIMDQVPKVQEELNRVRSMMDELVRRLRRIIGYDKNKLKGTELAKAVDAGAHEFIGFESLENAIQSFSSGVFPQELIQYLAILDEELREVTGHSKMSRAQRINVETAHEVERVHQGQEITTSRIADAFEEFAQDVIRIYAQGRRQTMQITGEEIVRIVGQRDVNGLQQWATVDPNMLHGEYEFNIVPGSTRPQNRERDAQLAALDLQIATGLPDIFKIEAFARRYVEARSLDPTRYMSPDALTSSYVRGFDETRRQAAPTEGPAGAGMDANVIAAMSNNRGLTQ